MSYSEILNDTTQRIKTQFNRHATLAIGESSILVNANQRAIQLPPFSCSATDLVNISFKNASAANADASPLRSAVITVGGGGVPTLTVTVAANTAGTVIEFNYIVYRAAN